MFSLDDYYSPSKFIGATLMVLEIVAIGCNVFGWGIGCTGLLDLTFLNIIRLELMILIEQQMNRKAKKVLDEEEK